MIGVDANARSVDLKEEVQKVRDRMIEISKWNQADHLKNRGLICEAVDKVVDKISGRG